MLAKAWSYVVYLIVVSPWYASGQRGENDLAINTVCCWYAGMHVFVKYFQSYYLVIYFPEFSPV